MRGIWSGDTEMAEAARSAAAALVQHVPPALVSPNSRVSPDLSGFVSHLDNRRLSDWPGQRTGIRVPLGGLERRGIARGSHRVDMSEGLRRGAAGLETAEWDAYTSALAWP